MCIPHAQEVFHPTCTLLRRLAEPEELAAEMAGCPNVLRHWDGILQLLARKADLERKYLDRLEGEAPCMLWPYHSGRSRGSSLAFAT